MYATSHHLPEHDLTDEMREERELLTRLQSLPRRERPTSVEVWCGCDRRHLAASLHPVEGRDDVAAWWVRRSPRTTLAALLGSGDLLGTAGALLEHLRASCKPGNLGASVRQGRDLLAFRDLDRLQDESSWLYAASAPCMPQVAFDPTAVGPALAWMHRRWSPGSPPFGFVLQRP